MLLLVSWTLAADMPRIEGTLGMPWLTNSSFGVTSGRPPFLRFHKNERYNHASQQSRFQSSRLKEKNIRVPPRLVFFSSFLEISQVTYKRQDNYIRWFNWHKDDI
jgi:hypothetical protein